MILVIVGTRRRVVQSLSKEDGIGIKVALFVLRSLNELYLQFAWNIIWSPCNTCEELLLKLVNTFVAFAVIVIPRISMEVIVPGNSIRDNSDAFVLRSTISTWFWLRNFRILSLLFNIDKFHVLLGVLLSDVDFSGDAFFICWFSSLRKLIVLVSTWMILVKHKLSNRRG